MLIVAAAAGLFVWKRGSVDWAGVIALVAFLIALYLRLTRVSTQPERTWYDGRAVAESTKTLVSHAPINWSWSSTTPGQSTSVTGRVAAAMGRYASIPCKWGVTH